jgi:hypothetical protein
MGVFTSNKTYNFEFLIQKEIATYAIERTFHISQKMEERADGTV